MFRQSGNADGGFSEDCLPVQATFTGDDKIRIFYVIRKPGFSENDLDAGFETAMEKGPEGKTKSSGGSGSGESRICFRIFLPGQSGIANVQPESYPYFLAKHTGWTVVNAGRCGYRATDYWNYLQSGAVSVQDADAIVILLGTNGGNDPDRDTPDNDAYWDILRWCHAHAPAATVFLGTPPHATRNPAMSNCGYADQAEAGACFVRRVAQETGDVLIDLAKCPAFCAENEAVMQPNDGLHFSAVGYELLAQNVEAVLRDHLKCD